MPQNQERRKAILRYITDFRGKYGYAPALHEIARAVQASIHTIFYYVRVFTRLGFVRHQPHKPRDLRVTEKGKVYAAA